MSCCRSATTSSSVAASRTVLRPVFHDLTPLTPPSADALRRALVEPAKKGGYRFEDDALVEEMVELGGV